MAHSSMGTGISREGAQGMRATSQELPAVVSDVGSLSRSCNRPLPKALTSHEPPKTASVDMTW